MTRSASLAAFLAALVLLSTSTRGDDIDPPTWRGGPGSTFTTWEFLNDNNPAPPTTETNPFGSSSLTISQLPGTWYSTLGGRSGVWEMDGFALTIPIWPGGGPCDLRLQVTTGMRALADVNWSQQTVDFNLPSSTSPINVEVQIGAPQVLLDEVVVDTICTDYVIPEPTTVLLLTTGVTSVVLLRRRRKRR